MVDYSLAKLAELTDSKLAGDPEHRISGVENLNGASEHEAAFLDSARYEKGLSTSKAGVICVSPSIPLIEGRNYLIHPSPTLIFQKLIELFKELPKSGFQGIHPTAVIHEEAHIAEDVTIGPHVVIDRGARIGARTTVSAGAFIGAETTLGADCMLHPHVTVREGCQVGDRVILQPGAVIGSCGFGYFTDSTGKNIPLKQLGTVVIEDDVEIGANATIDRARFKETRIGRESKLDNLVQIAHQVELGPGNLIASQVGIAGSTKTGRNVMMGGQVGVIGHVTITDHVIIAARAAVSKGIDKGGVYSGIPAAPIKEFNRQFIQLRSVGKMIGRLKDLEAKAKAFESLLKEHQD